MSNYLEKTIKFVDKSFGEKKSHFERTVYWLLKLKPDADEAMKVAAYAHDIQRAFGREKVMNSIKNSEDGFQDKGMMKIHQVDGAKIMGKFLQGQTAPKDFINKVKRLIANHETGGDEESDLIKDADSISYFDVNVEHFITKFMLKFGKKKIKDKFDWMYNRISLKKAKEITEPMYNSALDQLELVGTIQYIAQKTIELKDKYIGEKRLPIDYIMIFSHSEKEFKRLRKICNKLGEVVANSNGPAYKLHKPIGIPTGKLRLLRIRKPDPERPQKGCDDFAVKDFKAFKKKHIPDKNGHVSLIVRPEYEMIEIKDEKFDVLVYFPSETMSKYLKSIGKL